MSRDAEFQARFDGKGRPSDFHRALAELSDYIAQRADVNDPDEGARCHVLYTETLHRLISEAAPAYLVCKIHVLKLDQPTHTELPS